MSETMTPDNAAGENADAPPVAPPPPRRGPGHRGQDIRDTMAEMAAKAHEISLEAGSKMASAMRDVVGAAAGISAFAIESARDLVNYMVRRGQMSQDEATKLLLEVEEAHAKRPKVELPKKAEKVEVPKAAAAPAVKAPEKPTAPAKSVKAEVVEKSEKAAPAKAPKLEKAAPKAAAKAPAPPKAAAKPAAKAAAKPAKKR